jgi:uncharacterized protein YcfL
MKTNSIQNTQVKAAHQNPVGTRSTASQSVGRSLGRGGTRPYRLVVAFAPLALVAAACLLAGCASEPHDQGPYLPQTSTTPGYEANAPVLLMDPGVQHSVTTVAPPLARELEDGRVDVVVQLRNRENRRIEVQANCIFKDINGLSTGDEAPYQTVILTENGTEQIHFVSANNLARKYTIHVRQAR